ncbi:MULTISPECIES: LysR substrate-binding domain-containing protein [unclassified Shimia]|uniref:LysR substrate-binding domain-containing protein n=1 Tax=unclassified Shimia TaxID=2630038 RepID=UPI00310BE34F
MNWTDIPSLSALRAFEAAARHQSLSAAARELNVTHAAIAQHVRHLETELATPLLTRAGRGVAPTEAGLHLARQLGDGFETIAEAITTLRRETDDRPLTVSATPTFATNWLMPRIGGFWKAHPEVSVNIHPSTKLVDLRKDGVDMAIRFGSGHWPGTEAQLLTRGDFWVVASPEFLKENPVERLEDTAQMPWVMEPHMLEMRRVLQEAGLDLDAVNMTLLDSNQLVLSASIAGLGISVNPSSLVERDVAAGTLKRIACLPAGTLGYYILTLPRLLSPKERLFKKWLLSHIDT